MTEITPVLAPDQPVVAPSRNPFTDQTFIGALVMALGAAAKTFGWRVSDTFATDAAHIIEFLGTYVIGPLLIWTSQRQLNLPWRVFGPPSVRTVAKLLLLTTVLSTAGASAGCQQWAGLTKRPDTAFVRAERLTYDAIAQDHTNYVNNDPALDDSAKARRLRTIDLWNLDLTEQEKHLGQPTTQPGPG